MLFTEFTALTSREVLRKLGSSRNGLSEQKAQILLEKYGQNKITFEEITFWQILLRQFKSPFVYLLFLSFLISFLLGEILDAFMILLFVAINTALGFYQEYKSESAVKLLKKYLVVRIKVKREGVKRNIETQFLVPGDLISLEPGDKLPADVRFIKTTNLMIDESVITGESQPVQKFSTPISEPVNEIYRAENIGFSGTTVVSGKGEAVVFATGANTNYAKIVKLTGETERESTFEKELSRFSKFTLFVVASVLIFVVVTSVAIKPNPSLIELLLFAIALAVSVIPEALPVVTTFSLSIGAISLAQKNVVVKRLSAIEDLGALEVLASDKTGTLTENKLTVVEVNSKDVDDCILKANLASGDLALSRNLQNNAFDIALMDKLDLGKRKDLSFYKKIDEIPFDPQRRRVTTIVSNSREPSIKYLITRGSPEEIVRICKLLSKDRRKLLDWSQKMGKEGKRVLAVAEKRLENTMKNTDLFSLEKDLTFLGLIAFSDPIKKSAYEAVISAEKLGISVKILTGDSFDVASSVAQKIRLVSSSEEVITGDEFEKLGIEAKHKAIHKYKVFARVTPEQKYDIIKLLQEKYSVGFLGEGINDAPALKVANVAVVVQGAADVAREASDIVLLKRDLKVILDGIREGRRVFENTSKYITATMASNFGNFFAVALVAPFINFLPMLPLQILLVNLLSDFPMIMVASDNVDEESIRMPKRYDLKLFVGRALSFGFISTVFDFILFSSFVWYGEQQLQTYWFIESILTELLFLFTIRTTKPIWKAEPASKPLVYLTVIVIFLTLLIPFTPFGRSIFGFIRPNRGGLLTVFVIVLAYLFSNEGAKFLLSRSTYKITEAIEK